jgi:DNA-binding MarR family transcriptional regulator
MTKTRPDMTDPGNCLCFNLRRAARLATRAYDEALAPAGLTSAQFSALAVLVKAGPLTTSSFSKAMETERTTSTRNLALMEREGLVKRKTGDDKRVRLIDITTRGRRRFEAATPLWRAAQKSLAAKLGEANAAGVLTRAQGVVAALE